MTDSFENDSKSIDELIQTAQNLIEQNVEVLKRPTLIRNQALDKKLSLRDRDIYHILNKVYELSLLILLRNF